MIVIIQLVVEHTFSYTYVDDNRDLCVRQLPAWRAVAGAKEATPV